MHHHALVHAAASFVPGRQICMPTVLFVHITVNPVAAPPETSRVLDDWNYVSLINVNKCYNAFHGIGVAGATGGV